MANYRGEEEKGAGKGKRQASSEKEGGEREKAGKVGPASSPLKNFWIRPSVGLSNRSLGFSDGQSVYKDSNVSAVDSCC